MPPISDKTARLVANIKRPIILHYRTYLTTVHSGGRKLRKGRFLEIFVSLNIKNPATVALIDELARRQGISKTAAIHQALTERLYRLGHAEISKERMLDELRTIRKRVSRLPELEKRSDEDIVGFDQHGLPN